MEYNVFKRRHHWSALVVLGLLILLVFSACNGRLCSTAQAQHSDARSMTQDKTNELPRIRQVVFTQKSMYEKYVSSRYWIKEADVIPADPRFRIENVKTLYSGYWGEGTSEYSMSPDRKCLLVSQETGGNVDRQYSDLLLVSLPSAKVKTLRGDKAGYAMLGWSSDSKLISYVSPIILPYPLALAPEPRFQLISYVSNQSTSPSYREPPDRFLYISAADGKWRRKVQAEVTDAVWIPGREVIVYTSYEKPGLVVYSSDGKKAVVSKDKGGGSLMLSGDGRKLLWSDGPKLLRLFEVPKDSSKLLDPKAWKTVAEFNLDPNRPAVAMGLSHDGKMVALSGPPIQTPIPGDGIQSNTRLAVLNLITKKSVVYSLAGNVWLRWAQGGRYLIGGYSQPSERRKSTDLAAIRIDPSSISHIGPIDWDNAQPVTPQILLEMPPQTKSITWWE